MSARSGAVGVARRVAARRRYDPLEQLADADPLFGADQQDVVGVDAQEIHELLAAPLGLGARQVDLVEDRDDLEPGVERQEQIRQRLRLDALRRVDDQDRALARRQRARHFVGEVDVTRRVDQVELVRHAVRRRCSSSARRSA